MKLVELLTVPEGVVTEIAPDVAPVGTVALMVVELTTVNVTALVPLKLTPVAPVKFVPLILTTDPIPPALGENELMVGGVVTVKLEALVPVPEPFITVIRPVVAPEGTVALMLVAEFTV